ncbi:MAG: InlB B-repeat-containing protein [Candidatus Acetothermia bacterium]
MRIDLSENKLPLVILLATSLVLLTGAIAFGQAAPEDGFNVVEDEDIDAGTLYPGESAITQEIFVEDDDNDGEGVTVDEVVIDNLGTAGADDLAEVEILDGSDQVRGTATVDSFPVTVPVSGFTVPDDSSDVIKVLFTVAATVDEEVTLRSQARIFQTEGSTSGIRDTVDDGTAETLAASETYVVTATAGANGTIDPSGDVEVMGGQDETFTIDPDSGYGIDDVTLDGTSVLEDVDIDSAGVGTYVLNNVTSDQDLDVTFADIYTVTATAGANGTIDPSGDVEVTGGHSRTFTMDPDAGYQIDDVTLDGTSVLEDVDIDSAGVGTYVLNNVTSDQDLDVTFAPVPTEEHTYTPGESEWMLVSFPLNPPSPTVDSVWDELVNPTLYTTPFTSNYVIKSESDTVSPDVGYWIALDSSTTISVEGPEVTGSTVLEFNSRGWHLISVPYLADWQDVSVLSGEFQDDPGTGDLRLVSWDGESYNDHYSDTSYVLSPWYGYWVEVTELESGVASLELTQSGAGGPSPLAQSSTLPASVDRDELSYPPTPPTAAGSAANSPNVVASLNAPDSVDAVTFSVVNVERSSVTELSIDVYTPAGDRVFSETTDKATLEWSAGSASNGIYIYSAKVKVDGKSVDAGLQKFLLIK